MVHVGQAARYTINRYTGQEVAAIYMGMDGNLACIAYEEKGEPKEDKVSRADLEVVRMDSKTSPTGKEIYYGTFCKKVPMGNFKISHPKKEPLLKELKTIAKHIKND